MQRERLDCERDLIGSDLQTRVLRRLNEDTVNPAFYAPAEVLAAINVAQRMFAFLTLCLEATYILTLTPGERYVRMLKRLPDYILPLRVNISTDQTGAPSTFDSGGFDSSMFADELYAGLPVISYPKLYPASLTDLGLLSTSWLNETGTPARYGTLKNDLLFVDKTTTIPGIKLLLTYARTPKTMVAADTFEIPAPDHQSLLDLAVVLLRCKEGGQELQKAAQHHMPRFIDAVKRRGAQVRARSLAQRYDVGPAELDRFDISRMLRFRGDLPPTRRENKWPIST